MYREIKFRVWDKDYKRMHTVGDFHHDSLEIDEDNNIYYLNLQCMEASPYKGTNPEYCAYRLMEYTGFKDTDGKEIYEGDILQIEDSICVVEFKKYGFGARNIKFNEFCLFGEDELLDIYATKVRGNIYENPELLEGN